MIGKTVSHYRIFEELGRGGMSVVYKALDLDLDRFVALKFLPAHLTGSKAEKNRFILEAKTASALQHANICTIHEIGESDDGRIFICMDFYSGQTPDKLISYQTPPVSSVINIIRQIALGLEKAHERGIVHLDIKPNNIIQTDDKVVKILDFGLARLEPDKLDPDKNETIGTIAYMSPERLRGDKVDFRSDIWSFGVVVYELLTGKLPFRGKFDQDVAYAILNMPPEPVNNHAPEKLLNIIDRCLAKDPEINYTSMGELLKDLNSLLAESPEEIPGVGQFFRPEKRLFSIVIPLSFAILLIISLLIFHGQDNSDGGWDNSIAVLPFENMSNMPEKDYICEGMTEQIISIY